MERRWNGMYARVIIDIAHANVDRLFTYEIPEGLAVRPGHRVLVPFGAGNRKRKGLCLRSRRKRMWTGLRSSRCCARWNPIRR